MKRILLVDDIEHIRADLRILLCPDKSSEDLMASLLNGEDGIDAQPSSKDYELDEASSGEQAVDMARKALESGRPYDLIITDIRMPPGIDGAEAIRRIRMFDEHTPVIVHSAYSDYSDEALARANGGELPVILNKPVRGEVLVEAVGKVLDEMVEA